MRRRILVSHAKSRPPRCLARFFMDMLHEEPRGGKAVFFHRSLVETKH